MTGEADDPQADAEPDFPRERFLELLRQVRHLLTGPANQQALLDELRIAPQAVFGRSADSGPAIPESAAVPVTIAASVLPSAPRPDDEPLPAPAPGEEPADYLSPQSPVATSAPTHPPSSVRLGEERGGQDRATGSRMSAQRFAGALLDAVSDPDHLDRGVALGRRALRELPVAQRSRWSNLVPQLEQLQIEHRRRALATGRSPDLSALHDWVGFECLHHYSLTDRFFGRAEYLDRLDAWVVADGPPVVCLTALGGAGKSALAWRWLNAALTRLRGARFRGALWCSFYEGTFQFEDFLKRALAFCGRRDPAGVAELSRAELEEQLVETLARERFLVVIDGLERLMVGYAQAAERAIDDEGQRGGADQTDATREDRRMSDRRDGALLRRLAAPLSSRLLITTRLAPADLEQGDGSLLANVERIELPGLSTAEAIDLWESILPDEPVVDEIADVLRACTYHPLAISVLARSVAAGGTGWPGWRRAPARRDFDPYLPTPAEARAHVIGACLRDLSPAAQEVLELLAVTGKPMTDHEIDRALREGSAAFGEDRWASPGRVGVELQALIALGLIGEAIVDGVAEYDLHPVVRGTVWGSMTDRRRASDRRVLLEQALSELIAVPDPHLAAEPVHLQKAASIFQILVSSDQLDRAWEVFRKMWWPLYAKGAYQELLDLFEQLLPQRDPQRLLPLASRREQALAAEMLGGLLMLTGEAAVADRLMTWCGIIRLRINDLLGFMEVVRQGTWKSVYEGRLFDAELKLRQVKVQAGTWGVKDLFGTVNPWIGIVLALSGQSERAHDYLRIDERGEANRRWWVQGVAEGKLYLGEHQEALTLLEELDENEYVEPMQQAWEQLTQGMAEVATGALDAGEEHLQGSLSKAEKSAYRIVQCFALLALAEIAVARGQWSDVQDLMDRYFQVDPTGAWQLTAGDAWRLRALVAQARGDRVAARELAATAYRVCACDGPPYTYAAGVQRARALLAELGGYVPRTSSRLHPEWRPLIERVRGDEAEIEALTRAGPRRPVLIIREGPEERERRRRVDDLERVAEPDDLRWWELVAGTDRRLRRWLAVRLVDLEMSIAAVRRRFDDSAEKSLEVLIFRLEAQRLLAPETPRPVSSLDPDERARWLSWIPEHERALDEFLRSDEAEHIAELFRRQNLDGAGVRAFSDDCRRRIVIDSADPDARRWWNQLEERRDPWDMLILAERIQAAGATLDEFLAALSVTGVRGIEYCFRALRERRAIARLRVTSVSQTDGWRSFEIQLRLQTVKYQLGWLELPDPVRAFWTGIEERNAQKAALVLQLAEELALRGSSISAYHEACLHSNDPEDPMATLAFLDYDRLRAVPWEATSWPDDVSVGRWSYDSATPTFRDVSGWTAEQIANWLDVLRQRICYTDAPARARQWWDGIEQNTQPATVVRLAEELGARSATVEEFYRAHVDADTDHLLAVLRYLDFSRLASKPLAATDSGRAVLLLGQGNKAFEEENYDVAVAAYESAIRADPTYEEAYRGLALAREQMFTDPATARQKAREELDRGLQRSANSPVLLLERRRLELGLPRQQLPDPRAVVVEVHEALVADVLRGLDEGRVGALRQEVKNTVGVLIPGIRFRRNDQLAPGAYQILFGERSVSEATTVTDGRFVLAGDEAHPPVWPSQRDPLRGEWREGEAGEGLTPYEYLLRHLRFAVAGLAARLLTEQGVLSLVEEGWSETPLDPRADLPLLTAFTEALRTLLDDQVPIVDADKLLDEFRPMHTAGIPLNEAVAGLRLRPATRRLIPGNRNRDLRLTLPAEAEQLLAEAALDEAGVALVTPQALHALLGEVRTLVSTPAGAARDPVLMVANHRRRRLARVLLRAEFPALPVVAEAELLPRDEADA